jgi:hypothetical protein
MTRLDAALQEWGSHLSQKKTNPHFLIDLSARRPKPHSHSSVRPLPPPCTCWAAAHPRRALPPSPTAPRARPSHQSHTLPRYPFTPIVVGRAADPSMAARTHVRGVSGLPRPSQGRPRAWPVLVVLARHSSPPAPM